jgi:hypothetical protein
MLRPSFGYQIWYPNGTVLVSVPQTTSSVEPRMMTSTSLGTGWGDVLLVLYSTVYTPYCIKYKYLPRKTHVACYSDCRFKDLKIEDVC